MGFLARRLGAARVEADEHYEKALSAYEKGKFEDAIEKLEPALERLPNNTEYLAVRGLCYLQQDEPDTAAARASFKQALDAHPGEVAANYGMGVLCFREKQWQQALGWFNRVRTISPELAEPAYYMALIYHRNKDNATAKALMEQAAQQMGAADDKRAKDAQKWVKTFERLIEERKAYEREQQAIRGETSGTRISRQEIEAGFAAGSLGAGEDDTTSD